MRRRAARVLAAALALALGPSATSSALADEEPAQDAGGAWSLHFQQTAISQHHGAFPAAYSGLNSLRPEAESKLSVTATVFMGIRPWTGAGLYFDPELSGGEGFSGVTGIAAFPNGEIYRIGATKPTVVAARLYLEQSIGLGGGRESVADGANQLAGQADERRLILRLGKFSLTDFFDDNRYSHDARTQFQNWALMGNGAWDYAADTRGYTWGLSGEYRRPGWSLRAAVVAVPTEANGIQLDTRIAHAHSFDAELERRHRLRGRPGALRLIAYRNVARMGNYREAIALDPTAPALEPTRRYSRDKNGLGLNLEQALSEDGGVFLRLGWNDGRNETWAFTEIDRTAAIGVSWSGRGWGRAADRLAAAGVVSGLSPDHRDYLARGGYGFIIGDGALRYGGERVLEMYYSVALPRGIALTADFQHVADPAFNRDRGPVDVFGLRFHLEL